MADPETTALIITATGTAVSGGILAIARLIDAISGFLESRRDGGGGSGKRNDLRRARKLEKQAQELRDKHRRDDDGSGVVPFEQAWVTG